ncbi:hypothetical protein EDC39_108108 [Geothermobacter ehrlichii]|uniref:Uncharacterized protein n=1 Tax=Geothermobacter ehrlichii TaxID=213224 RepID=A0A5D3WIA7_9BACT|nr:hypothetical protein [Geothermobacter ehrlichii]TYO98171.1 hypothetical protein EDC39_108108 [Geothermobacter ehrlichii]
MNTQSHAILTCALLRLCGGKRLARLPHINLVLCLGALTPDLPIYLFFIWGSLIARIPQQRLWNEVYFHPGWTALVGAFHSFPLWTLGLALCWKLKKPRAALFCAAALLGAAEDFFLHHNDAHMHFWPLSRWRFISPISYWNPAYHGIPAALAEIVVVTLAGIWLWPRLASRWGKGLLALAMLSLIANHGLWVMVFRLF